MVAVISKFFMLMFFSFIGLLIVLPIALLILMLVNIILGCIACDLASLGAGIQWILVIVVVLGSVALGAWMREL